MFSSFYKNTCLLGKGQIGVGQLFKVRINAAASCYHNNIPAGGKPLLIESVNLPQTTTHPIPDHSMSQLFAGGDAHPIGGSAVGSGIKYQIPVGMAGGGIETPENMIQLQCIGKLHNISPLENP